MIVGASLKGKQDAQAKARLQAKEAVQQRAYEAVAQLASPASAADASPEADDGEGEYEIVGVDIVERKEELVKVLLLWDGNNDLWEDFWDTDGEGQDATYHLLWMEQRLEDCDHNRKNHPCSQSRCFSVTLPDGTPTRLHLTFESEALGEEAESANASEFWHECYPADYAANHPQVFEDDQPVV